MNENTYLENQNQTMGENSFMKTLLKKRLNQKGLTLIELLAVIVILAIVAAIAIPAIGNVISNSRVGAVKGDAQTALAAANIYFTDKGAKNGDKVTVTTLVSEDLLDSPASLTGATEVTKGADGNTITGAGTAGGVTVNFSAAGSNAFTAHANNTNATTADATAKPVITNTTITVTR